MHTIPLWTLDFSKAALIIMEYIIYILVLRCNVATIIYLYFNHNFFSFILLVHFVSSDNNINDVRRDEIQIMNYLVYYYFMTLTLALFFCSPKNILNVYINRYKTMIKCSKIIKTIIIIIMMMWWRRNIVSRINMRWFFYIFPLQFSSAILPW